MALGATRTTWGGVLLRPRALIRARVTRDQPIDQKPAPGRKHLVSPARVTRRRLVGWQLGRRGSLCPRRRAASSQLRRLPGKHYELARRHLPAGYCVCGGVTGGTAVGVLDRSTCCRHIGAALDRSPPNRATTRRVQSFETRRSSRRDEQLGEDRRARPYVRYRDALRKSQPPGPDPPRPATRRLSPGLTPQTPLTTTASFVETCSSDRRQWRYRIPQKKHASCGTFGTPPTRRGSSMEASAAPIRPDETRSAVRDRAYLPASPRIRSAAARPRALFASRRSPVRSRLAPYVERLQCDCSRCARCDVCCSARASA
jgi:hypothetical protein